MSHASRGWAIATIAALIVVIAALVLLLERRRSIAPSPPPTADLEPVKCEVPPLSFGTATPGSEDPPIVLVGPPKVRFYLDGKPVVADAENPPTVAPGEHELRVELEGQPRYATRFRVAPFTPGLFEAELHPTYGLTVSRLGTVCTTCPEALDVARIEPGGLGPTKPALTRAADALRRDDWRAAAEALAEVPARDRRQPIFLRMSAITFAMSHGEIQARETLERAAAKAKGLRRALAAYDRVRKSEQERRERLLVVRWNRVTERFAALSRKFEPLARNQVARASERMVSLTSAFETALENDDGPATEVAVRAAEETLIQLATQLRGLKPTDCEFQNDVAATLLQ